MPEKRGYLLKQGNEQSTWMRRWCVCDPSGSLTFYKKQPPVDSHAAPLGMIPLRRAVIAAGGAAEVLELHRQHTFIVALPQRRYVFAAQSGEECDGWLQARKC